MFDENEKCALIYPLKTFIVDQLLYFLYHESKMHTHDIKYLRTLLAIILHFLGPIHLIVCILTEYSGIKNLYFAININLLFLLYVKVRYKTVTKMLFFAVSFSF
jgi:hypothetical protein